MRKLFKKLLVTITERKLEDQKQKIQLLLTDIVGECYINKLKAKDSPLKSPILIKKEQKKEENRTSSSQKIANEYWNNLNSQIHCNNFEWVDPKSRNVKNTLFIHGPTSFI